MFTIKDTKFRATLQRMQSQFGGKVSFVITVPPEMVWWYFQEFGTASYAERGTKPGNESGYHVRPVNALALKYYDRGAGNFRIVKDAFVLGIPAHHMVTDTLPEIQATVKTNVITALQLSGYSFDSIHAVLLDLVMPQIKELLRQSFETKLDLAVRPDGKIAGTAEAEFQQKATIREVTTV